MSFDATKWAWKAQVKNSGQRLVLLNLADRANEKAECWPSQKKIARDTCMAERTVRARLAELEASGLIKRKHRNSRNHKTSDLITLQITGKVTASAPERPNSLPASDAASHRHGMPQDTGMPCREINQELINQTEPNSIGEAPFWFELMPQPNRPDIDRYNQAVEVATDIATAIGDADWSNPGLQSLKIVESWLKRVDEALLRQCLIDAAARARRSGTRIHSWHYFSDEVAELPKSSEAQQPVSA